MWSEICIEGYCFGEKDNKCPCGQRYPTVFCLENGHCPNFAYAKSNAREVAYWAPLHLIIWDKLKARLEDIWWKLRWIFWDRWSRQRRKVNEFFKSIPVAECPEYDSEQKTAEDKFPEWYEKAKKGICQ